jgi:hypothetical protein
MTVRLLKPLRPDAISKLLLLPDARISFDQDIFKELLTRSVNAVACESFEACLRVTGNFMAMSADGSGKLMARVTQTPSENDVLKSSRILLEPLSRRPIEYYLLSPPLVSRHNVGFVPNFALQNRSKLEEFHHKIILQRLTRSSLPESLF